MTSVRRLFVLLCGFEILPKTVSTRNRGANIIMSEPISVYLLDTESGWILIDAGVDPAYVRDAQAREKYFYSRGMSPPVILPVHELDNQLKAMGLVRPDISHVVLTHLHYDHTGYAKYFPHAKVSVQRREYENWRDGDQLAVIPEDINVPTIRWNLIDGDYEVVPGLTMIDTRGHTEGHQSAVVELNNVGVIVLPIDAGDLQENFDEEILPGASVDDEAAMTAILRIKKIAAERNGRIILFHDPVAIQKTRLAPAFYD
jgi:N-acyl homoserine lactone hydrolase